METTLITILFAHVIGDFFLQHKLMAGNKYQKGAVGAYWCSIHVLVYTATIALCVGNYSPVFLLGVYVPHWVLDRWSLAYQWMRVLGRGDLITSSNPTEAAFGAIIYVVLDQTAHLTCLYVLMRILAQ